MVRIENSNKIALLPIKPHYINAIINGEKKVEFRRCKFKKTLKYVVMYASSPTKKIVGFFRVAHVTYASPTELWDRFQDVGGIEKKIFDEYYKGASRAVAISIDEVFVLNKPLTLDILCESLTVPQSFVYLPYKIFNKICSYTYQSLDYY